MSALTPCKTKECEMIDCEIIENLEVIDNIIFTNSLFIAKVFEKNHRDVLKNIKNLCDDEFKTLNFKESFYLNSQNKKQPCYNLTRDGFSLLVMGFTGEKAYKFKIEFIKAFNEMEKRLKILEQENIKKLALHQSLGYKSQLAQQKEKYQNKIKALQYDLDRVKNTQGLKRKLSNKELRELKKILAKDYDIICFDKTDCLLFAEKASEEHDIENRHSIYKGIKNKFERKLIYWQNYEKMEKSFKAIFG
ncbi:Rha family transcriptional regulator [Helicobacter anatolicus]|uniref:Rha family transcriptional regulator n=1 Tax=Helicobacter anatolicus TaxID=2905874 RepID=UPI001E435FCA|nr:Rha family transcriptional regulator [Helicobacter anatolicus]MCE3040490.1 Rha family transcriptional regulator [Helicobacter anatolicus]